MSDNQAFGLIIGLGWTQGEADLAQVRQQDAYASDAVECPVNYVRSIGDARVNGGWNFS